MTKRYQRGNQNPYIEEEQTTQWPKQDKTKGQTTIYETLQIEQHERCVLSQRYYAEYKLYEYLCNLTYSKIKAICDCIYSPTCIKRSYLGQRKVAFQDLWPLQRGSIHMKFSITGEEKCDILI